jgi:predicted nucleotidyltransferase
MEIIKTTVKVGNSAGVILPKKYLNSKVKIILEPLNIEKDVIEILLEEGLNKETIGAYIVGSYARNEQTPESDIDILIVTSKTEKRLKQGNYDLLLINEETLGKQLKSNILPLLPMIKEAKPILNKMLLGKYQKEKISKTNLSSSLNLIKSALNLNELALKLEEEKGSIYVPDSIAYSLVLNLRSLYIIDKLKENRSWSNKELLYLVKKISGSIEAYEGYLRVKKNQSREVNLSIEEAKNIYNYLKNKTK